MVAYWKLTFREFKNINIKIILYNMIPDYQTIMLPLLKLLSDGDVSFPKKGVAYIFREAYKAT